MEEPRETAPAGETAQDGGDADAFVQTIDFRYQKLFGQVTLAVLLVWGATFGLAWWAMGWGATLVLLGVGTSLLGLFAMRTVVHVRSARLAHEVSVFQARWSVTLEHLLQRARGMSPPAAFFMSLMDGPLARHRRDRDAAARRKGAPGPVASEGDTEGR